MQTPAPVEYARATSVEDALAKLERYGPDAQLIAGGHSLIPMMRIRIARPEVLIDIGRLRELDYIRLEPDPGDAGGTVITIGALTTHATLLDSAVIAEHLAIVREAERTIADPVVRNWGTIGGSLCQADPAEDLSAVAAALKARLVLRSPSGTREVPARDFTDGPYQTVLGENEMLVEVRVPVRPGAGSAYRKVERRAGDWAVAAVGAYLQMDGGTVRDAGLGMAALGAAHDCAPAVEDFLIGRDLDTDAIAEAGRLAAAAANPNPDQRGPVAYKRHLADELTRRALRAAADRTAGGSAA